MKIPFLCRVGFHNWDHWSDLKAMIALGFDLRGKFEREVYIQRRKCLGCGKTQQREVK